MVNLPPIGYNFSDEERMLAETRSGTQRRSEFARDRARVLHSSALRRLGAKTQVLSPTVGDFARTRLTHSLEVAQIGREIAITLGMNPDVVDMACLAHDLGHPPFGHNGEKALNDWSTEFGGFEGNAQTLRLLTRIEPKVFAPDGSPLGLNLTRASLDATCKYPWVRSSSVFDEAGSARSVKFGAYEDDLEVFNWLRVGSFDDQKCIEAQVMDFSDDVAYSVHDYEDAIVEGFIDLKSVSDQKNRDALVAEMLIWAGSSETTESLDAALTRLQSLGDWMIQFDNSDRSHGDLKNLTSALIGSFVSRTVDATMATHLGNLTRYSVSLIVPPEVRSEIAVLKGLVSAFLMSHESRQGYYDDQRAKLIALADKLLSLNGAELDSYSSLAWSFAKDEAAQHRVIVDQIACYTDQSAVRMYQKLCVGE